jgi:hypothetical protein
MALPRVTDCPECRGAKAVILGVCTVCFAEFDDWHTVPEWARIGGRDPALPVVA